MAETYPIFPLHSVLFPGGVLSLKIFESRYLDMVSQCMRSGRGFIVALIEDGKEAGAEPANIHPVGVRVSITDWNQLKNGLLGIYIQAETRVTVLSTQVDSHQLLSGQVEEIENEPVALLQKEFSAEVRLLKNILSELDSPYDQLEQSYEDSSWVSARLIELLPLDLLEKQHMLEMHNSKIRMRYLHKLVVEMGLLTDTAKHLATS